MKEKKITNETEKAPQEQSTISPACLDKKNKNKKNTSLRLDKKTLKTLKMLAIENETSVQKLIETLIHEYIQKHNNQ